MKTNHFLEIPSHDWPTAADQWQAIGSRCFEPEMTNLGSDGQPLLPQGDLNYNGSSVDNISCAENVTKTVIQRDQN